MDFFKISSIPFSSKWPMTVSPNSWFSQIKRDSLIWSRSRWRSRRDHVEDGQEMKSATMKSDLLLSDLSLTAPLRSLSRSLSSDRDPDEDPAEIPTKLAKKWRIDDDEVRFAPLRSLSPPPLRCLSRSSLWALSSDRDPNVDPNEIPTKLANKWSRRWWSR